MFRTNALIATAILDEQIAGEIALIERERRQVSEPKASDQPAQSVTTDTNFAAGSKAGLRARIKALIVKSSPIADLARKLRGLVEDIWARLLPVLIHPVVRVGPDAEQPRSFRGKTVLFVGGWRPQNAQLDLVRAFDTLREICECPVRLILAGRTSSQAYVDRVQSEIEIRKLKDVVIVVRDPEQEELDRWYGCSDLFLSSSFRDYFISSIGSCPPPVRAMACDVPVLACGAKVLSSLLGRDALILETHHPDPIACAAKIMLEEPWLRRRVVAAQRKQLWRLKRFSLIALLIRIMEFFRVRPPSETRTSGASWQIEGPFDSAYSLAVVNREVALALSGQGRDVGLVSRDGPGPFAPAAEFLAKNPAVAAISRTGQSNRRSDVALRNTYPPWVFDLAGDLRGLVCYAWEESGFPADYVRDFNCNLDLVTVTSRYVAKVLRDNGVRTPIRVVGDGIDQIIRLERGRNSTSDRDNGVAKKYGLGERFCFLHISSGFPRKGVDLLLAAWASAFRDTDDLVLVIKGLPNQHHQIDQDVAALDRSDPHHAPIVVINQSIDDNEVYGLYQSADVVVAPSRGEGFGLPLAEALALGKPVITTAFGGQMDFCSSEDAWLCDYDFAYAQSHLSPPLSVWAEPRLESLVGCLREARMSSPVERSRRGQSGRVRLRQMHTWRDVALRLQAAVADVQALDQRCLRPPKVGWVSTWNSRCGIAAYSQALTSAFPPNKLAVFANWNAELLGPEIFVYRTWEQGWNDPLDRLYGAIVDAEVDAVVIQFNFGFFGLSALSGLIERLGKKRIPVYLGLHSTTDIERPELTIRLSDADAALARARRLLVHSVHDLNRLKARGFVDNVTLLPFGLPQPPLKKQRRGGARKLIASFGYLLAHKGVPELIEAVAMLRQDGLDVDLLLLNALYPAEESTRMRVVCENAISEKGLGEHIKLRTDYLSEAEVVSELAAADLVVYPYQQTQESASAAVRLGLASLAPVATTPLPIFDDIASIAHRLPGTAANDIAAGLKRLLLDSSELCRLAEAQKSWVTTLQWQAVSRRLYALIRGEFVDDVSTYSQSS
jgi:glycosyltransferase involved in cell wall biosynthesis